jgi:hypothetical protein
MSLESRTYLLTKGYLNIDVDGAKNIISEDMVASQNGHMLATYAIL